MRERVPAEPFRVWAGAEILVAGGVEQFVSAIGWAAESSPESAVRRLHRWLNEGDTLPWLDVYEVLTYVGAPWWDMYPDQADDHKGRRVDHGRIYVCDESTLAQAHTMHLDGMSVRQVARDLFDECYSASPKALCNAFLGAFHARGWEVRGRSEATALSNRQRAWRPQCSHIHQIGPHRGDRCARQCVGNDEWCWRHDPDRIAAAVQRLREAA